MAADVLFDSFWIDIKLGNLSNQQREAFFFILRQIKKPKKRRRKRRRRRGLQKDSPGGG
jgi:hypothetical protein